MSVHEVEGLLERDAELATLQDLLERIAGGAGAVAIVEAPPGIGKTRLLESLRARASDAGATVLHARGSELEREFTFGVVRQLFEPLLRSCEADDRARLLAGAAALAQDALAPAAPAPAAGEGSLPILHGLHWLVANVAERSPVVLVVDDAQWADEMSLRFLSYMARRVGDLPALLAVALRPADPSAEPTPLGSLVSEPDAVLLRPRPLTAAAVSRLVRAELGVEGDPDFCDACHTASAGNPFFVRELLREVAQQQIQASAREAERIRALGPRTIARALVMRVASLPQSALPLARAVAILGDGTPLAAAAALAGLEEGTAADAADALVRASIFGDGLEPSFVHPIVRAAIYADFAPQDRAEQHGRAARLLADRGAPIERVAEQIMRAAPAGDAARVEVLREAARRAAAGGGQATAVAQLRRALSEPPSPDTRAEMLLELGCAEARASLPEAISHLREAHSLQADPARRAQAALELGRALLLTGRPGDAIDTFERAIADAPERELTLRLEVELIGAARFSVEHRGLAGERLSALRGSMTGDSPAERLLLANLAFEMVYAAEPIEEIAEVARRALRGGRLLAEEGPASPVTGLPIWALVFCDRYEDADAALAELLAGARALGSASGFSLASTIEAAAAYRRGRLGDAELAARNALERSDTPRLEHPLALAALIEALVDQGEFDEADRVLTGRGMSGPIPDFPIFAPLSAARARLRLARGAAAAALQDALDVGRRAELWGNRNRAFVQWRAIGVQALLALGEGERARSLAGEGVDGARAWGAPRAIGIELRSAGMAEGGETGLALLRDAVSVLEGSGATLELARALVELGAALRRGGERAAARDPLARGLELAVGCGAEPLAEQARVELAAAGARPRGVTRTGADALTPSERRIAELAAQGMTNSEIAQALFVTVKTVETHLRGAYRKLSISGRAGLPVALQG